MTKELELAGKQINANQAKRFDHRVREIQYHADCIIREILK